MNNAAPIEDDLLRAKKTSAWVSQKLVGARFSASLRMRAAAACFAFAMEHHDGIAILLSHNPPAHASAFALIRPIFDSYVRALWLCDCATDEQVAAYTTGTPPLNMPLMLTAIESAVGSASRLRATYVDHWDAMCAHTHTGAHQIQRWNSEDAIEPQYRVEELKEVLRFSGEVLLMAAIGVAGLAGDLSLPDEFEDRLWAFSGKPRPADLPRPSKLASRSEG